jgi:hypothetical protein
MRPPRTLSPRPAHQVPGQRDAAVRALMERSTLVLVTLLGPVVGIQEPVLLRFLAEPTGA